MDNFHKQNGFFWFDSTKTWQSAIWQQIFNLATDLLNGFGPYVFNRPYVTRSKSNMRRNLELTGKLITFY